MLSGVEVIEVFAVSPKRSATYSTLEEIAGAYVKPKPRKRKNVALVSWGGGDDGGGASYVVGALVAAEVAAGGRGLRLELAREGGQVAAERRPAGVAPGGAFSGQRCTLFLDFLGLPRSCQNGRPCLAHKPFIGA